MSWRRLQCSREDCSAPEKIAALGYPGAKISLKENDVPTLFPVLEAMLPPSIRRSVHANGLSLTMSARSFPF